jgi:glycosyltransferase involved in cell wall biosynthesis
MTTTAVPPMSLVIPAYNEENRIVQFFDSITGFEGELIVVCDGTDQTADIVDALTRGRPDLTIRCLRFDHRLGKGGGVIEGLKVARAPLVGYVDADGSTSIREMVRLFASLPHADGAIGSRWVSGSTLTIKQGFMRRLESRGFNLLIRLLFGLTFHDTQCGAKVFTKTAVDTVLPLMTSRGFEFDVELLWRLGTAGFRVVEVPIEWQNKGDSHVQKRDMLRMLTGLFKVRFGKGPV